MSLSDEEQRRFAELVGTLEDTNKKAEKVESRIKAKTGLYALLCILGLGGLLFAVITQMPFIGVLSFGLMLFGAYKIIPQIAFE